MRVTHAPGFTIRALEDSVNKVDGDAWNIIRGSVQFAIEKLKPVGHLFVTVVPTDVVQDGDDAEIAYGWYDSGLFHIVIAGRGRDLPEFNGSEGLWLLELATTALHEVTHYWQDTLGLIRDDYDYESEADAKVEAMLHSIGHDIGELYAD